MSYSHLTSLGVWYQHCRPTGLALLCSLFSISSSSCQGVNPLKEAELESHITTSNLSRCWSNDCTPYSGLVLGGKWSFLFSMAGVLYAFIARKIAYWTYICSHFHVILLHFRRDLLPTLSFFVFSCTGTCWWSKALTPLLPGAVHPG